VIICHELIHIYNQNQSLVFLHAKLDLNLLILFLYFLSSADLNVLFRCGNGQLLRLY